MTNAVTIDVETDAGSLEALAAGIAARSESLKKTTSDSMVAAAITILRSLKAATKKAPVKAPDGSFNLTLVTQGGAQFRGYPRRWRPIVNGHWDRSIRPVNLMRGLNPPGNLYKIELTSAALLPRKGLNKPFYYVMAPTEDVAKEYAKARVERALRKESGLARTALAMAQAKASTQTKSRLVTREEFAGRGGLSERAANLAYESGRLTVDEFGYNEGTVGVEFFDALNYSTDAAGESAVSSAVAKAANSLLGAFGSAELKQELADFRTVNPDAKFVDIFRSKLKGE